MPKIKRFIDCYVPVTTCNFRCSYCYITQQRMFDKELPIFKHTADEMAQALSYERMGGPCLMHMCGGGETLLPPEVPGIIKAFLAENHYVAVVTNGVLTQRFEEIAQFPKEYLERLFFKFSFHYEELVRTKQLDRFFDNVKMMRATGASFTLEITPYDELIPHIEDIKKISMEKIGALPHITVARDHTREGLPILTKLSKEEYEKTWSVFDSKLFDYKLSVFNVRRKEFCYAGDWSLSLNIDSGELMSCYVGYKVCNIYDDISKPIPFEAIGCNCQEEHCYNAHGFIAFGTVPSLEAPTHASMRNRVDSNGNEFLSPTINSFFSSKLKESNCEYSCSKKMMCNLKHSENPFLKKAAGALNKFK
ncbi:MAG: radical SAM protein [Brevinema sp.]